MTITARFPGKCKVCGQRIHEGERIEWVKGVKGATHEACAMSPEERAEYERQQEQERERQEAMRAAQIERAKDRKLYLASPNQIAAMSLTEAQAIISFHQKNPPTMDYMVEYSRSLEEMGLAQARIAELS